MSVVVTGAAGFIGRWVVAQLRARGHEVVGVDRRPWTPVDGESALVADLLELQAPVLGAFRRADGVIHLAGRPGVRDAAPDARRLRHLDNVVAGEVVCRTTPRSCPLIVASSSSVYGGSRPGRAGDEPVASAEADPLRPQGGYARSKLALEAACRRRDEAGGHVAVLRPFTVAGEGQRPDMAFSRWIAAASDGRPLVLLGDPDRRRDVTDVRDVADGFVRALERGTRGSVNLGTGRSHRLRDLASTVAAIMGVELVTATHPAAAEEVVATRADTTRCRRELGFVPQTDLAALVARQVAATTPVPSHLERPARALEAV
jgi:nucleoside-diphosphate-sugar epimerase